MAKKTYCGECKAISHFEYFGTDADQDVNGQFYWVELFKCVNCENIIEPFFPEDYTDAQNKRSKKD